LHAERSASPCAATRAALLDYYAQHHKREWKTAGPFDTLYLTGGRRIKPAAR